jgi:hypothetical protein
VTIQGQLTALLLPDTDKSATGSKGRVARLVYPAGFRVERSLKVSNLKRINFRSWPISAFASLMGKYLQEP